MSDKKMKKDKMMDSSMMDNTMMDNNMMDNNMMDNNMMATKNQIDIEILNYALKLEYLETEFYSRVVAAQNAKPYLKPRVSEVATKLYQDESAHVTAVTDMIVKLGGTPIAKPEFMFPDEPFLVNNAFLSFSADLEATGVMAYLGQGKRVKDDKVLAFAASIYGIEARHVGLIRYLWGPQFAPEPIEEPKTMREILAKVSPYIVGGSMGNSMS